MEHGIAQRQRKLIPHCACQSMFLITGSRSESARIVPDLDLQRRRLAVCFQRRLMRSSLMLLKLPPPPSQATVSTAGNAESMAAADGYLRGSQLCNYGDRFVTTHDLQLKVDFPVPTGRLENLAKAPS